jgi:H+/Cl- antiporter ClcA
MNYTLKQRKRLIMVKVAVIFTIFTFLIDQGVEALVIAQWAPVWVLRLALIVTVILFPFIMYITWVIINRKKGDEESYEDHVLNIWLLVCSILLLVFAILQQFM